MPKRRLALLVVDGYNVVHGSDRYRALVDDGPAYSLPDAASLSRDPYGHDPLLRARDALIADVAAYAKGTFEAVVVFDAAGNLNPDRPDQSQAGVRVVYSDVGESADTVIERLVVRARKQGRDVRLVTSDNTIRYTVGGEPVASVSSAVLAQDLEVMAGEVEVARVERTHARMTLGDRLSAEQLAKLRDMLGN